MPFINRRNSIYVLEKNLVYVSICPLELEYSKPFYLELRRSILVYSHVFNENLTFMGFNNYCTQCFLFFLHLEKMLSLVNTNRYSFIMKSGKAKTSIIWSLVSGNIHYIIIFMWKRCTYICACVALYA